MEHSCDLGCYVIHSRGICWVLFHFSKCKIIKNFKFYFFTSYLQMHHGNVMPLLLLILDGIFAFTTVLIACELGHRMNSSFERIVFTIEQLDWYLFPIEVQRMLPMIIAIAQQPVTLECFGSIMCNREVFKNVSAVLINLTIDWIG